MLLPIITADRVAALDGSVTGMASPESRVCLADVFDEDGNLLQVYLKVCSPMKTILAGDVLRWLLAAPMQVPVPSRVFMVHVPIENVEALWPDLPWREWWGRNIIPGFASISLAGVAPAAAVSVSQDADLIARLKAWPGLLPTVALDLWCANADDNLSNTLEIVQADGSVSFATIDGGCIMGSDEWTMESIRSQFPIGNRYRRTSKMAWTVYGMTPPCEIKKRLMTLATRHRRALDEREAQIRFWLNNMLDTPGMAELVINCLRARAPLSWLEVRTHATTN